MESNDRSAEDLLLARRREATVRLERQRRDVALGRAVTALRTGTATLC